MIKEGVDLIEENILCSNHILRLQIGSVCCEFRPVRHEDLDLFDKMRILFNNFLSDQPPDFCIELEGLKNSKIAADIEAVLPDIMFIHENQSFRTNNQMIQGQYDLNRRIIRITGEKNLVNIDMENNFLNRLIALSYYSACKVKYEGNPPAFLVHSCGVLHQGRVIMFAGPSETGKTTIARWCNSQRGQVLNDEMVLVSRPNSNDSTLKVQGAPIVGGIPQRLNTSAPLNYILMLKQSHRTIINSLSRSEAYLRLIRQVVVPAYIGQRDRRAIYSLMAEFSDEVTRTTPVFELEFTLDQELLWSKVEELEKSLRTGKVTVEKGNGAQNVKTVY
jgi:hypothetical protein